jgi:hypothetical protein
VPTDKICGQSLLSKISVDMNSIFMKLYVTWPWPNKGHIPQKFEFSKWFYQEEAKIYVKRDIRRKVGKFILRFTLRKDIDWLMININVRLSVRTSHI